MSREFRDALIYSGIAFTFWVILIAVSLYSIEGRASSVPVGVMVTAVNCPPGAVLVLDDVETQFRVDDRGKLKTVATGLASYPIQVQIHDMQTGKDFESVSTTAAMGVEINLDCAGSSFVTRQHF